MKVDRGDCPRGSLVERPGYQMAQYKALGNMLETVLGVDYKLALFIGVAILTVYVVGGGMISAVRTDFIQMIVMIAGVLIVFIVV
ncbi:sodium:solute symporter family transporter [Bacillus sp. CH30_1T]|uniref:sodium:solute symporter family transporter n=1 Tax=Bacillus sp. CH30_1T TaxID=2604836 RepID=UPI0021CDE52A|nr:hypothetical protein [Bacillus sp. CH30_1T]